MMKKSLTFVLGNIAGQLDVYNPYYNVQNCLNTISKLNDKRGAIRYGFYHFGIMGTSQAQLEIQHMIDTHKGHQMIEFEQRALHNAKSFSGTWVQLVYQHLSDGSKALAVNSVNAKTILQMLDFINHVYLGCKSNDVRPNIFKWIYRSAKASLLHHGVNPKRITASDVMDEIVKENHVAKTAHVPF